MRKIIVILMIFAIIVGMSEISVAKHDNKNDGKDNNPHDGNAGKGNDDRDKHNDDDNSDDDSDDGDGSDDGNNNSNSNNDGSKSLKFPSGGSFTFGTSDCDRIRILLQIDIDERIRAYKLYNIYWGQQRLDTLDEMIDYCERPPQNFDIHKPISEGYYTGWTK